MATISHIEIKRDRHITDINFHNGSANLYQITISELEFAWKTFEQYSFRMKNGIFELYSDSENLYRGFKLPQSFDLGPARLTYYLNDKSCLTNVTTAMYIKKIDNTIQFKQNNHEPLSIKIDNNSIITQSITEHDDIWKVGNNFTFNKNLRLSFQLYGDYLTAMSVLSFSHTIIHVNLPKGGLNANDGFYIDLTEVTENHYNGQWKSYTINPKLEVQPTVLPVEPQIQPTEPQIQPVEPQIQPPISEPQIQPLKPLTEQKDNLSIILNHIDKNAFYFQYLGYLSEFKELLKLHLPDQSDNIYDSVVKTFNRIRPLMIRPENRDLIINKLKDAVTNIPNRIQEYKRIYELTNCCQIWPNYTDQMRVYDFMEKEELSIQYDQDLDTVLRKAAAKIHGQIYDEKNCLKEPKKEESTLESLNPQNLTEYQIDLCQNTVLLQKSLIKLCSSWVRNRVTIIMEYNKAIEQIMTSFNSDLACQIVRLFQQDIYDTIKCKAPEYLKEGLVREYRCIATFMQLLALHSNYYPKMNKLTYLIPNKKKANVIILSSKNQEEKCLELYGLLTEYVKRGKVKRFTNVYDLDDWWYTLKN